MYGCIFHRAMFWVYSVRVQDSWFRFQGSEFRGQVLFFSIGGQGFRVQVVVNMVEGFRRGL